MLDNIIKEKFKNNGNVLTLKQALEEGMTRVTIENLYKNSDIDKLGHGLYGLKDELIDEFYLFQLQYPKTIFSNNTSLFFQNKTERIPTKMDITIYSGYNDKKFRDFVNVHRCKKELLDMGATEICTPQGQIVKAYNLERTLCDIIKNPKFIDSEVVSKAIKMCIKDKKFDANLMWEYAEKMHIYKKVKIYMEANI